MEKRKLKQSIEINAPKQKVWDTMLNDETYRQWTVAFHEGSHAIGNWEEGSKMIFTDGSGSGMLSRVKSHARNEELTLEHYGMMKDNKEDLESDEVKKWAGSLETYRISESGGKTHLEIEMDITPEYEEYMNEAWKKALELLKNIAEK